jgi:hypothetical protein
VRAEVECGRVTMSERGDVEGDVIGVISQGGDDGDPLDNRTEFDVWIR